MEWLETELAYEEKLYMGSACSPVDEGAVALAEGRPGLTTRCGGQLDRGPEGAAAPLAKSLPGLTPLDTGSFDNWSAGASLGATL